MVQKSLLKKKWVYRTFEKWSESNNWGRVYIYYILKQQLQIFFVWIQFIDQCMCTN